MVTGDTVWREFRQYLVDKLPALDANDVEERAWNYIEEDFRWRLGADWQRVVEYVASKLDEFRQHPETDPELLDAYAQSGKSSPV
jgi:hypothetical protein